MAVISFFTSMAGVSGAFVLLPFQMSILNYTSPGVSATNFVYNIVSIPSGIYRHIRQKTLCWPLFNILMLGSLPGVFLGYFVRITYLPDPKRFKIFAGLTLAYLGFKTVQDILRQTRIQKNPEMNISSPGGEKIINGSLGLSKSVIACEKNTYIFSTPLIFFVSMGVGTLGGAYGIGGGAIMAPFCISVLGLPVYLVSGAALFSTWVTSILAAIFYSLGPLSSSHTNTSPDWLLGILFGLGGMVGIYMGTRLQLKIPSVWIKAVLATAILFIAGRYLMG